MHIPSFIYLYDGGKTESLDLKEILRYLKNIFKKSKIQIRQEFIRFYLSSKLISEEKEKEINHLAKEMAKIKVRVIDRKDTSFEPLPGEIEYEKKRLSELESKSFGVLYNGFELVTIFSKLINKEEFNFDHCHIIFTNQLFGTWDEYDMRWHARVSIYSFPSIISTTGIVEAPAKPREFYLKRRLGIDLYRLKEEFKGRFIDYNDQRMTEIMKGYVLQALFYHMTGDPFCEHKNCRFYNAHWQEEIINAQLSANIEFCERHKKIINQLANEI
ncbi:MAG: hypothetical protein NC899_01585 [Candidatus Omnitrophica bacterium]|nr:hypothetical protein [Candidatus Omnitrophota bacterium]